MKKKISKDPYNPLDKMRLAWIPMEDENLTDYRSKMIRGRLRITRMLI